MQTETEKFVNLYQTETEKVAKLNAIIEQFATQIP
jgi:hypothetical protein